MDDQDNEIPKHRSKKNTKRWCKGKVGKEHQPVWVGRQDRLSIWLKYTCQECGKILDHWWSWGREKDGLEPPAIGSSEPKKKKEK